VFGTRERTGPKRPICRCCTRAGSSSWTWPGEYVLQRLPSQFPSSLISLPSASSSLAPSPGCEGRGMKRPRVRVGRTDETGKYPPQSGAQLSRKSKPHALGSLIPEPLPCSGFAAVIRSSEETPPGDGQSDCHEQHEMLGVAIARRRLVARCGWRQAASSWPAAIARRQRFHAAVSFVYKLVNNPGSGRGETYGDFQGLGKQLVNECTNGSAWTCVEILRVS
jgi:hypothetical protein